MQVAWKYHRATRAWDRSYIPAIGFGGFTVEAGDALWVIAGSDQTLTVEGRPPPAAPSPPRALTLAVREGSDLLVVPEGTPTTAAALFGGDRRAGRVEVPPHLARMGPLLPARPGVRGLRHRRPVMGSG